MKIHGIVPVSRVNGPGARFVVWVQGCSRACPGCFNPLTHSFFGGYSEQVENILQSIPVYEVDGITVSGGEPFEQADELKSFLTGVRKLGLHRFVYTGFTYEELVASDNRAIRESLDLIDILVDGPYLQLNPSRMPWIGSDNQRVWKLNGEGMPEQLFINRNVVPDNRNDGEILIRKDGTVMVTGIFNSTFLQQENFND